MDSFPKRGDLYWICLDPTVGTEIKKTRPCVVLSNNAQNKMSTRLIIAPITSNVSKFHPFEARVMVKEREGKVMLDQVRSVDKSRLGRYISSLDLSTMDDVDQAIKIAFAL